MKQCEYGCGKVSKYILKSGKYCCETFSNKCEAIRTKNSNGLKKAHQEGRVSNFTKEQQAESRAKYIENLKKLPFEQWGKKLKKELLFEEQKGKCLWCEFDTWNGKRICLEMDHIDGNKENEQRKNLRLLCPNCHAQTDTYKSKNKKCLGGVKVAALVLETNIERCGGSIPFPGTKA